MYPKHLKLSHEEYVWVKFPPQTAKEIVDSWVHGDWDHKDCLEFIDEVVDLLMTGLKIREADEYWKGR